MARRVDEPVRVALCHAGTEPAAFIWEGRHYVIEQVEACWKEVGPWWDGEGERTFFRVTARPCVPGLQPERGLYELRFDHTSTRWWLQEVID